jgi:hypothetical protein
MRHTLREVSGAEQFYPNFAELFLSQFISDQIECAEPPAGFDVYTKQDLAASDVPSVIEFADPQFEDLTNYAAWHEHSDQRFLPILGMNWRGVAFLL